MPPSLRTILVIASFLAVMPCQLGAQYLTRPTQPWETITTPSFRVHYPADMRSWVLPVAERLESYAAAIHDLVGSKPATRTRVMVEDPGNVPNGFAVPLLDDPTIFLWPTPPAPGVAFGTHRGWGEVLAVHEYGHIAHLTVASRNGGERFLWRLLPARLGPVARKAPSWVIEGYATYIEGRLTGNGRPNSVGRPAILRQWALEGQLPNYRELNSTRPFLGGAMRYLVGSAFLEWLVQRKGEASLRHLWQRMSAKQRRSFNESFRGVYGAPPDELYGAFYTEVMEKAFEARRELRQAGLVEGDLVQRLAWGTGDPAVSKDGNMVAVVLRSPVAPARVVVWSTLDEGIDSSAAFARRRVIEADPGDVAPVDSFPAPKRVLATLRPSRGRGHDAPRWFSDGERLLVVRDEALGDGALRPDLFIWNRRGGMRRVTRGAGIRTADPTPDGKAAIAVQCRGGICDVVRVDLANGKTTRVVAGAADVVWHRPRVSADGRRVALSVQRNGTWSISIVDALTGAETPVTNSEGASRYAPSWTPDGRLVVVSEAGGVPNLESIDPARRDTRSLTRVTGAVAGPDVGPDGRVWYLSLHARGYDLRRLGARSPVAERIIALDPRLTPAAPRTPNAGLTFRPAAITGPSDYGLGPRGWRILPGMSLGPDGDMASLTLASLDPIGRWSTVFQGAYGQRGAWRGGSAMTALRTRPLQLDASIWYADHAPSKQVSGTFASLNIDSRFTGIGLGTRHSREKSGYGWLARAGGSIGRIDGNQLDGASRAMAVGEVNTRLTFSVGGLTVTPRVKASAAAGSTAGESWSRRLAGGSLLLGGPRRALQLEGTRGTVTAPEAGDFGRAFEQFAVGGAYLPFLDPAYLSQRVSLPSVPVGYSAGSTFALYRASLRAFGVQPYAVWVSAGDSVGRFQRVFGVENEWDFPSIGFVKLPATRIRAGVGYSLDRPYDEKLRPYVSVTYRP